MKIAFFTDHKFVLADQLVYTSGALNKKIWDRYLFEYVDSLSIYGRKSIVDKPLEISSHDSSNVYFNFLDGYSNIYDIFKSDKLLFRDILADVDMAICRFPGEIPNRAAKVATQLGVPVLAEIVACVRDGLFFNGSIQARLYSGLAYLRMISAVRDCMFASYVTNNFLQNRYPCTGITSAISDVNLSIPDPLILKRRIKVIRNDQS